MGRRPPSATLTARADELRRVENALHGSLAQARIGVESRGDGTAGKRPHDQAAAGPGVAEIEHLARLAKAPNANAANAPFAFPHALDPCPQGAHGIGGMEDVLAFEQPRNAG